MIQQRASSAVVISASSDIGDALCRRWAGRGWRVAGTYRTDSDATRSLRSSGVELIHCDMSDSGSVKRACAELRRTVPQWNALVLCPGSTEPVGEFQSVDFSEWEASIRVNFTAQLQAIHELLPARLPEATVLLFAGGGTNNAPRNYSAYIVSKIALMKMCELLDAEVPDTKFAILGPGWVKTKIHQASLRAPERAGANYQRIVEHYQTDNWTPVEEVLDCCDWIVDQPRQIVGGRNFSVVFDAWGSNELETALTADSNLYKLRRHGNDRLVRNVAAGS